jgi:two-component system phosphate regulon sensor histidine kinase PhoR
VPNITVVSDHGPNGKVKLSISDKGLGIAKENQQKIFDKFYRVPTGDVHNVKGFGLGLFYTKNICEAHGWKISLESEPNKGTCVTILMG